LHRWTGRDEREAEMEARVMQSSIGIGQESLRARERDEAAQSRPKSRVVTHQTEGRRLRAKGLGWFSVGLGLAELLAPTEVARLIGIKRPSIVTKRTLQFYGARELLAGVAILSRERPTEFLIGRVIGDAVDLATLGLAMAAPENDRAKLAIATAAVAGVTALDILTSVEHARIEADSDAGRDWQRIKRTSAVTVKGTREAVEAAWRSMAPELRAEGELQITNAPGNRGVEVRLAHGALGGRTTEAALRRLKSMVEIGEILVSDASIHAMPHAGQPGKTLPEKFVTKGKDVLR
jgi:hypothetical protein